VQPTAINSAVISTAQSVLGDASGYFDGTADLAYAPTDATRFGTDDFTIEFWLYVTSSPQDNQVIATFNIWPAATGFTINYTNTTIAIFTGGFADEVRVTRGGNDAWHHYAFVRQGGVVSIYVDGVPATPTSSVGSLAGNFTDGLQFIGRPYDVDFYKIHGYLDDFRIVKGLAVYEGPFNPPSAPLSACAAPVPVSRDASLLLHFDGDFDDASPNGIVATASGASIDTTTTQFGSGSGYFDGASFVQADGGQPTTDTFTVEAWLYATSVPSDAVILDFRSAQDNDGLVLFINPSLELQVFDGALRNSSTAAITLEAWHHVALSVSDGNGTYFIDGVSAGSLTCAVNSSLKLRVGMRYDGAAPFYGNIDDLRVVSGLAVYTGPFNPPTSPLPACATPVPVSRYASLLLHFDGDFDDASPNDLTVTVNGDVVTSSAQSKFGGESGYFDEASTLAYPDDASVVGYEDFTIEFWAYPISTASLVSVGYYVPFASDAAGGVSIVIDDDGHVWTGRSLIGDNIISSNSVIFDEWNHIAVTRQNGVRRIFVNGSLGIEDSTSTDYTQGVVRLGSDGGGTSLFYDGYIDDLRIVKGLAVYSGPFNPPTAPLAVTATPVAPTAAIVQYLVVAGGGGGGSGGDNTSGGGGGGGYLAGTLSSAFGDELTVTVGGGGAGDTNGSNSSLGLITAYGGGCGGGQTDGASGGCGGGGGCSSAGTLFLGGVGSQGGNGGTGQHTPGVWEGGGGGGGAGGNGVNGDASAPANTNGGVGIESSINGTPTYRAGGGGGGICCGMNGDGGTGGGGTGGSDFGPSGTDGGAGEANKGGGGGGTRGPAATPGAGGSGVVILRTLATAASTTGSPSVTTDGSHNVYTFTGSGSITF
jgi:hypothetical protein